MQKVRFGSKDIAQAFIDKFNEEDRDILIPAPFGETNSAEYWGVAIVATNKDEELDGYDKFIANCKKLGLRPRFVFLNRIDSKLIKDDKIEEVGLPWLSPDEAEETPIDMIEEPIEDSDINNNEPEAGNEPNIEGAEFSEKEASKVKSANNPEELVQKEWVDDYEYYEGVPLVEEIVPIDSVRLSRSGTPDKRYASVRKLIKQKETVQTIKFIDLTQGDADEFIMAFEDYANRRGWKEDVDYTIVKDDYLVITEKKFNNDVMDMMQQYGVKLYHKEDEEELEQELLQDIDETTDIPEIG